MFIMVKMMVRMNSKRQTRLRAGLPLLIAGYFLAAYAFSC